MKNYYYIIYCILFFLISCAEEGPFKLGKLECEIEVTAILPNMAVVNVNYPNDSQNLFDVGDRYPDAYLSSKPFDSKNTLIEVDDWIRCSDKSDRENGKFVFADLEPGTTYYFILQNNIFFNGNTWDTEDPYYYTGTSFTTSQEGDYSAFKFEFVDNVSLRKEFYNNFEQFSLIKLIIPSPFLSCGNMSYDYAFVHASLTQNMTDEIFGKAIVKNNNNSWSSIDGDYYYVSSDIYGKQKDNEIFFLFPLLEKKKYYLQYDGRIYLRLNGRDIEFDSFRVDGTVDLSGKKNSLIDE